MNKIALAGNPNVGKSTVFNALTGLKQHTGNWSGKTVELASGSFKFLDKAYDVYDLPGTYSVISNSPEEKIARDYICFSNPKLTIIVADATCLERNLNLVLQILEMNSRVLLCVNLLDEAENNGISVDTSKLEKILKIPVIGICARKKCDIKRLKSAIYNTDKADLTDNGNYYRLKYPDMIECAVQKICASFEIDCLSSHQKRFTALKLIDNVPLGEELVRFYTEDKSSCERILKTAEDARKELSDNGVVPIVARDMIVETIVNSAREIGTACISENSKKPKKASFTARLDRLITSKKTGIPIMLCLLGIILWITIFGANYPSQLLSRLFEWAQPYIKDFLHFIRLPDFLCALLCDGVYGTTAWVTAVMLPPMAIFFPLFTLLEDFGLLPRIAFNLDKCFKWAGTSGKQSLTMCMGLGCNAVGVTGCRIISSPKERLAAQLTNAFIPCNGRFGLLTALSALLTGAIFTTGLKSVVSALFVLLLIVIGAVFALLSTAFLTKFVLKNNESHFALELPPYRRPELVKTLTRSLLDRTLKILLRAISVSAPAGAVIWLMSNLSFDGVSVISICTQAIDPIGQLMGLDGVILLAFILSLPANEILLPIILMCYLSSKQMINVTDISSLSEILKSNGWTVITAVNVMLFSVIHFPCATTLKTIKAETESLKWTIVAFILPTVLGIFACMFINFIVKLIYFI